MNLLDQIWGEKELAEKLALPIHPKTGNSRVLRSWIYKGLRHIKIGEKRYFLDKDVVDFLTNHRRQWTGGGFEGSK